FTHRLPDLTTGPANLEVFDGESIQIDARGDTWVGHYDNVPAHDLYILGGSLGVRGATNLHVLSMLLVDAPASYYCQSYENPAPEIALTYTLDQVTYMQISSDPLPGAPMGAFELTFGHIPPNISCELTNGAAGYSANGTIPGGISPRSVSINVLDEVARLDWFVQIHTD